MDPVGKLKNGLFSFFQSWIFINLFSLLQIFPFCVYLRLSLSLFVFWVDKNVNFSKRETEQHFAFYHDFNPLSIINITRLLLSHKNLKESIKNLFHFPFKYKFSAIWGGGGQRGGDGEEGEKEEGRERKGEGKGRVEEREGGRKRGGERQEEGMAT